MTWLLVPATDRAILRRVLGRLDAIMGYPRTHSREEPGLVCGPRAPLPRTDTLVAVYRHDLTGAAQLHGALAVAIDDYGAQLGARRITHDGTTRTLAEWVSVLGWEVRATLPDSPATIDTPGPWTRLPHRDGADGSATGTPIPEGDE
jgi:hypothetical protein